MILLPERIELDHPDDLHLARLTSDDAEVIRQYTNANSIADPRMGVHEMSAYRARLLVDRNVEDMRLGERAPYTIRDAQGVVVGDVELYNHKVNFAEIQYSVADHLRRRRVATVAVNALIEHGREHWGLTRLGFIISPTNEASHAFASSIGATYQPGWDRRDAFYDDDASVMQYWEKQL